MILFMPEMAFFKKIITFFPSRIFTCRKMYMQYSGSTTKENKLGLSYVQVIEL